MKTSKNSNLLSKKFHILFVFVSELTNEWFLLGLFLILFVSSPLLLSQQSKPALQKQVTLQLKWKHQFQFAGYYAAKTKGYYQEVGLDVNLLESNEGQNSIDAVVNKKAEFGICNSDILIARSQGKKIVVLSAIFQHSPQVLLASRKSGIEHVQNLIGKKLSLEANSADIITYMTTEGVALDKCIVDYHLFSADKLINGEVDAISAYSTDEPFILNQEKFDFTVISPTMGGIDFYSDILFTSQEIMETDPDLVEKFRDASLKGWKYAMENPDEIIEVIYNLISKRHSKEHLKFEADKMNNLILSDVIEIGYSNPGRWESILKTYKNLKMVDSSATISGLLYSDYKKAEMIIPWKLISLFSTIIFALGLIIFYIYNSTRKLKMEINKRNKIQNELLESENIYSSIIKTSPDGISICGLDGVVVMVSVSLLKIFGYKSESEFIGKKINDFLVPEDRERANKNIMLMFEGIYTGIAEYQCYRKDGTIFYLEANAELLRHSDGTPSRILIVQRDITERKNAELALKNQEQFNQAIIDALPGIFYLYSYPELKLIRYNNNHTTILGYEPNEIKNMHLTDFLITEGKDVVFKAIEEVLLEGMSSVETTLMTKDGNNLSFILTGVKLQLENEIMLMGVGIDITDRKRIEFDLRQSRESFQLILNSAAEAIYGLDLNGNCTFCNTSCLKMIGYKQPEELLGKNMHALIHHSTFDRIKLPVEDCKIYRAFLNMESIHIDEEYLWRADGTFFPTELWSYPIYSDGVIIGSVVTFIDITDRKKAQEELNLKNEQLIFVNKVKDKLLSDLNIALEESDFSKSMMEDNLFEINKMYGELTETKEQLEKSQSVYRLITDNSSDVIWVMSLDTMQFSYISPSVIRLTGFTVEEASRQSIQEALSPESAVFVINKIRDRIVKYYSGDSTILSCVDEVQQYCKDGSLIWVDISTTFTISEDGKLKDIIGVSRNFEQRKKTELLIQQKNEALSIANAEKDKLFSIIAHDLRSPFQAFLGYSDMIAENTGEFDMTEVTHMGKEMLKTAKNIFKLLEDLLEWARVQQGKINNNPKEIEISSLISDNVDTISARATQKGLTISNEVLSSVKVFADEQITNTILRNLISNAVKFTPRGGSISINAESIHNNMFQISVRDTGVGIPADSLARLFKVDGKISTKGTEGEKSTGLGLLLCKEFVELQGGGIWVESIEGKGSTFYFTLPGSV